MRSWLVKLALIFRSKDIYQWHDGSPGTKRRKLPSGRWETRPLNQEEYDAAMENNAW